MKLDRIFLKGFKSIRKLELELHSLNVLIGANGAGKSNFVTLFELLNEIVEKRLQSFVQKKGGADAFLYFGQRTTPEIELSLWFGQNGYACVLMPSQDGGFVFTHETCYFQGYEYNKPYEEELGLAHRESKLREQAKQRPGKVAEHVLSAIMSWHVYHFHDTSESAKMKQQWAINDNFYLRPDASNLAAFLFFLERKFDQSYNLIRDTIQQVAPFFDDFVLRPNPLNPDEIRLEWREKGSDYPFTAHHLSDGTLRFICLSTLLLQPNPPSTIVIDEPELGLHPYAITVLAEMLKSAAEKTQVIVSTQSVPLINQLQPEDIIIVDRLEGQSSFRRLREGEMKDWIDDYGLGDLWEKNLLGGRP
jgi:predicted ATPase